MRVIKKRLALGGHVTTSAMLNEKRGKFPNVNMAAEGTLGDAKKERLVAHLYQKFAFLFKKKLFHFMSLTVSPF